jgi:hypothetical protein
MNIIQDARHQELNIVFTFEMLESRMIIKARCDRTIYQTECKVNPDIDFKELMDALESKQFKFVSKTPETLNLKVGVLKLDFKNFENMPGIELSEKVDTLSNRLN